MCVHELLKDEHMLHIIHLSDLHCHLRCPLRHHLVMLWLDLHLEIYQHEPVVYPGRRTKGIIWKLHSQQDNDTMRQKEASMNLTSLCCWSRLSRL